jgi:hypothetical protein
MPRTYIVVVTASMCLLVLAAAGCGTPQIGADNREAMKAVDALYTAVGLKDPKLVAQCEANLKSLRDAGKLPRDSSSYLESIIADANAGKWQPAQERLSKFMEEQRR